MEDKADLIPINIEDEMKRSYLDYAMSVIVSRALPDVRDGLKPVHRRILYAMHESGCDYNKPYRKSARIVGEVMGKYHPHGDMAIYDSLVRMAQNFSLRVPLVDGQGNFGSMDGDSAAAMRYTESRLAKVTHSMLTDIEYETVDFHPNYDGSEEEPTVLPARFPNLLVNGTNGIAVGMATNIPPHNLGEVIDACAAYIDNPEITIEELNEIVKGPDFPTGGIILGHGGIRSALATGRGSILLRGKTHFEEIGNKQAIIITEIPYQVNKAKLVEKIAELVRDKKIEGISALRDESNKAGVRIVVECKRDAVPDVVLNQLFNYTPLQSSFAVNALALDNGVPKLMGLAEMIRAFINFREVVITRRTIYLLNKARDRAHILLGLVVAVSNIDEVISLIRGASDPAEAKEKLLAKQWSCEKILPMLHLIEGNRILTDNLISLSEEQAKAILDMRLQRLTGLEHQKIHDELEEIAANIKEYNEILSSRTKLMDLIKTEMIAIKDEFATPRLTAIEASEYEQDIEDLIQREDMVITVTIGGYIKRVPLSTYRAQRRGGKGRSAMSTHAEDITTKVFVANTHTDMLFFSSRGKVYKLKVYRLPLGNPQSKGRALVNLLPLAENEVINNILSIPEDRENINDYNIIFATKSGNIRRNAIDEFLHIQSNGKIAMKLEDGDELVGVKICKENSHILLASYFGKAVRFPVSDVRIFKGRASDGIRGMRLSEGDRLISLSILNEVKIDLEVREALLSIPMETRIGVSKGEITELADLPEVLSFERLKELCQLEEFILSITENGYGKRSSSYEYRVTSRGTQGITNIITSPRNGNVVASFPAKDEDDILLITDKGKLIRLSVGEIRIIGRSTQGVKLFNTNDHEVVSSTALIEDGNKEEKDSEDIEDSNIEDNSQDNEEKQ